MSTFVAAFEWPLGAFARLRGCGSSAGPDWPLGEVAPLSCFFLSAVVDMPPGASAPLCGYGCVAVFVFSINRPLGKMMPMNGCDLSVESD